MHPLLQLAAAWVGSLGFAMLFNVRGKKLPLASLGGLLAWAVMAGLSRLLTVKQLWLASPVAAKTPPSSRATFRLSGTRCFT